MKLTRRLCPHCKHYSVAKIHFKDAKITYEGCSAVTDPEIKELISMGYEQMMRQDNVGYFRKPEFS